MATIKEKDPTVIPPPIDAEVLIDESWSKTEEFFQKNKKIVSYVTTAIVLAIAGIAYYFYSLSAKNEQAQSEMFQAIYYFEADSLEKSLKGDGNNLGFIDIVDEFGSTKAGNLAKFYAGAALLQQGKYEESLEYLKDFSANDALIQARAFSLAGDANLELNNFESAVEYYKKAAGYLPNEYFTPRYLLKLGMAQELKSDFEAAAEAYERIINDHPRCTEVTEAKKLKAMVEAKQNK
ncbi:MAG: cytochrome C biosynthesis protein [Cytophagales bacterium]|nr:MAG: cytochrome C biosynthesis protein [Cytophagales bacterium]